MASIKGQPNIRLCLTLEISEDEARALDALTGYGDNAFIKVFYEHLGKQYMQPYESALRAFFQSVRQHVPALLSRADSARQVFQPNSKTHVA